MMTFHRPFLSFTQAVVPSPTSSSPSVSDLAGGAAASVKAQAQQVASSLDDSLQHAKVSVVRRSV